MQLILAATVACALVLIPPALANTITEPSYFMRVAETIAAGIAEYEESGMESLTRESADEYYLFVLDREGRIVAHGADPSLVGRAAFDLVEPDKTLDEINAELDSSGDAWVKYRFVNPATGSEEFKRSHLVLHDGYAFGSGVYVPLVRIGAIVPLTGGASGYGAGISAALRLAVEDFNSNQLSSPLPRAYLALETRDSATSIEGGHEAFVELYDSGVRLFAGPAIDDAVHPVVEDPRSADSVLFSCCSVTVSHSKPDGLFRAVPDHSNHGEALAAAVTADGPPTVVFVGRNDPWITELFDQTAPHIESAGGTVLGRTLYENHDHGAAVSWLASAAKEARDACGSGCPGAAVVYVGFEETAEFVDAASLEVDPAAARWFGADANTVTPQIAEGRPAEFAEAVGFTSVQPIVYSDALDALGRTTVYDYAAYNSIMALGGAVVAAGTDEAAAVREAIPNSYASTVGVDFELNDNGDLASIKYGIWEFSDGWNNTAYYDSGSITQLDSQPGDGWNNTAYYDSGSITQLDSQPGGGCLIATAAHGTELAPAVQRLREVREGLAGTGAGSAFLSAFNHAYYSFSPAVADLERQSPELRALVRAAAAPMVLALGIVSPAQTEAQFVALGVLALLANAAMYAGAPAAAVLALRRRPRKN